MPLLNAPRERAEYRPVPAVWQDMGASRTLLFRVRRWTRRDKRTCVQPGIFIKNYAIANAVCPLDKATMFCHAGVFLQHPRRTMMALAAHIAELAEKHRLLERRIEEEAGRPGSDDLEIHKLKLEKLRLKDEIVRLSGSETRH